MISAEEKLQQARNLLNYYQYGSREMNTGLRSMILSKSAVIGMVFQTLELMTQQEWEDFAEIGQ